VDEERGTRADPEVGLAAAYAERTKQVHEARAALAEGVAALTVELDERRGEVNQLRGEVQALRLERDALREEVTALKRVIRTLQNMKVVRWTAPLRSVVYRTRARRS
jgi:uncharacterized coiled-coil DUF342 family protein